MSTKNSAFDTDRYFEEYSRAARTGLAWVYPTEVRALLEKAVDLQIEAGKTIATVLTENVAKFVPNNK
jgi:hypothetical protein